MRNRTYINAPSDWRTETLESVCEEGLRNGLYKGQDCYGEGVPMIHMGDVFGSEELTQTDRIQKVFLTDSELDRFGVQYGDLVFARRSLKPEGAGDCTLVASNEVMTFESSIIRARPNTSVANPEFLLRYFLSPQGKAQMMTLVRVVAVSGITSTDLAKFQIPLPPLNEQAAIANITRQWDQAIETVDKLIDNARARKKALMQQLLTGKRRLPGFEGAWASNTMEELFSVIAGKSRSSDILPGAPFIVVDMGGIDRSAALVASKTVETRLSPLREGDLIMPKDDIGGGQIIGRVAYIPNDDDYELGDHVYRLRLREKSLDPRFFYYRINHPDIRTPLRRKANGTAQLGLGKREVCRQIITYPKLEEQKAVARVLDCASDEIQGLVAAVSKLRTEKRALMQQLLTGKRRVKVEGRA